MEQVKFRHCRLIWEKILAGVEVINETHIFLRGKPASPKVLHDIHRKIYERSIRFIKHETKDNGAPLEATVRKALISVTHTKAKFMEIQTFLKKRKDYIYEAILGRARAIIEGAIPEEHTQKILDLGFLAISRFIFDRCETIEEAQNILDKIVADLDISKYDEE